MLVLLEAESVRDTKNLQNKYPRYLELKKIQRFITPISQKLNMALYSMIPEGLQALANETFKYQTCDNVN